MDFSFNFVGLLYNVQKNIDGKDYNLFSSWLHAGSSSVGLPSRWKPMKSDQTMVEVPLRPGDKEYNDVLSHFQTSAGGSVKVSEVKIISTCQRCMYP